MKIEQVKKETKERKSKSITVRTFPSTCKWMAKNKVSPTKLFNQAIEDLKKLTK